MKKSKKKKLKAARAAVGIGEVVPVAVRIDWHDVLLVCGRCAGKLVHRTDDKGRSLLRGEIRDAIKARGGKRAARAMETGCFGVCPKGGQVVATASGLRQGKLYVFDGADDGAAILDTLLPVPPVTA